LKAHPSALYKVKPLTVNLIATGDEDGTVKLWDNRTKTSKLLSKLSVLYKHRQFSKHSLQLSGTILTYNVVPLLALNKCDICPSRYSIQSGS
jgi:WD40 repeat protein